MGTVSSTPRPHPQRILFRVRHRATPLRAVAVGLFVFGLTGAGFTVDSGRNVAAARTATAGGEVVYSTTVPQTQAYGVRTTGSQAVRLPLPLNNVGMAGVSPDGRQVAVAFSASEDGSVSGHLQVAATNGAHKRTIWKFMGSPLGAPAWNAAGTEIAITVQPQSGRGGELFRGAVPGGLWIVSVKSGRPRRIAPAAHGYSTADVAWSPNGKSLVYTTAHGAIRTIPSKGGPYHQLAVLRPYTLNAFVYTSVAWSPKGNNILIDWYQETSNGSPFGHSEVQQVRSGGGPLETLLPVNPSAYYMGATYSPDGGRIAVITAASPPPGTTTVVPNEVSSLTLNTLSVNRSGLQTIISLSGDPKMIGWLNRLS